MHHTTTRARFALVAFAAIACAVGEGALAGPLTPPAGAIGASMKTLAEVEPRMAINAVNTPGDSDSLFKITAPGSYYLTGNLQGVAGKNGIEVAAANVTIDLNGFSLVGTASPYSGVVTAGAGANGTEVKNGSVSTWGQYGVLLGDGGRVENVRVSACGLTGIWTGQHCQVTGCDGSGNGGSGIAVGLGGLVKSCTASLNGAAGMNLSAGSVAEGCVSSRNTGTGIELSNYCVAKTCNAHDNSGSGFECSDGNQLVDCAASSNTLDGITAWFGVRITNCTVFSNVRHGISVGSQCTVIGNLCRLNGAGAGTGAGVHITTGSSRTVVEGNTCVSADFGIKADGPSNLVKGNTCSTNTLNYEIVAGNRVTVILALPTSGAISGNVGGSSVSDPDANYAY